jgi:hypothetical protein
MNLSTPAPLGGLISVAVLIPNIIWALFPPPDLPGPRKEAKSGLSMTLGVIEQVARVGAFATPFFCTFVPLHLIERTALVVLLAAPGLYYLCWIRYFTRGRGARLLYQPLWGVPVPMAVSPAIYFAAASVMLHAPWLAAATMLLSVSHIPLTYREARRLLTNPLPS